SSQEERLTAGADCPALRPGPDLEVAEPELLVDPDRFPAVDQHPCHRPVEERFAQPPGRPAPGLRNGDAESDGLLEAAGDPVLAAEPERPRTSCRRGDSPLCDGRAQPFPRRTSL